MSVGIDLQQRLDYLIERLRSTYDGIGHSSGRPYVYFVYRPSDESLVRRLASEHFVSDTQLTFHTLDVLRITIESLAGQEEQRQKLLNDPRRTDSSSGIVRLWARRIITAINKCLENTQEGERPVIVLQGLAALHPLGNPTALMEFLAEQEPRNPLTGTIVPVVLVIPGTRPPQTSRVYLFLDQEKLRLTFYRGEEI
jgi:hypothetical protein